MPINIKYGNRILATIPYNKSATIKCAKKSMHRDIIIECVNSGGYTVELDNAYDEDNGVSIIAYSLDSGLTWINADESSIILYNITKIQFRVNDDINADASYMYSDMDGENPINFLYIDGALHSEDYTLHSDVRCHFVY